MKQTLEKRARLQRTVHEGDAGLVERVCLDAALFHEGAAEDDGEESVLDEHDLLLDGLVADLDGPRAKAVYGGGAQGVQ